MAGKKNWYFADGYLPEKISNGPMTPHEALMLFNTESSPAEVTVTVYFSDREPIRNLHITVPPERIISRRLDLPGEMDGAEIPLLTQYALRIESTLPIVVQFGRLDTTQNAMSYYVGVGFAE